MKEHVESTIILVQMYSVHQNWTLIYSRISCDWFTACAHAGGCGLFCRYEVIYGCRGRWRWRRPSRQLTREGKPVWNERSNKCSPNTRVEKMASLQRCRGLLFFSLHWLQRYSEMNFSRSFHLWSSSKRGSPATCHFTVCLSDSTGVHQSVAAHFPFLLIAGNRSFLGFLFIR